MSTSQSAIRTLRSCDVFQLKRPRYGIGVSWERLGHPVDVDLQALLVDKNGTIVDAVFYNNLRSTTGAIIHSGDEQTGDSAGDDEVVWVTPAKLPEFAQLIIFVLAAHSGGHLRDIMEPRISVLEEVPWRPVATIEVEKSQGDVDIVALMKRSKEKSWSLRPIDDFAEEGQHFMDILEPTIGNLIRRHIPKAPKRQQVSFSMLKGSMVDLPSVDKVQKIRVAVGWDLIPSAVAGVDLDISAVFFHTEGRDIGAVYFDNTQEYGLTHTGDCVTGGGNGDDEVIIVELKLVPDEVAQIFFVVNLYSKGMTFDLLDDAYCRVTDDSGNEFAHYLLHESCGKSGLVIARLFRLAAGRWGFQAIGKFCSGRSWMDPSCIDGLKQLFHTPVREVYLHPRDFLMETVPAVVDNDKVSAKVDWNVENTARTTHSMQTGALKLDLPMLAGMGKVHVGLGWDIMKSARKSADLDVSCVLFTEDGRYFGAIYFDNPHQHGVSHTGDNLTGEGAGDDEVITVDLAKVPGPVFQAFFVVNMYTKDLTFDVVQNAYCRVFDEESGTNLVRYVLRESRAKSGLIIARLFRKSEHDWGFEAVGCFCRGRTWMDKACMKRMYQVIFLSHIKACREQDGQSAEDTRDKQHDSTVDSPTWDKKCPDLMPMVRRRNSVIVHL